jgi:ElaB/YqjD/DUF883 family membrane-anchored ribosome-binding protein
MEASTKQQDPWEPAPALHRAAAAQEQAPVPEQHFRKKLTTTVRKFLKLQRKPKTTFKELQNADLGELAENAKEYARQKPGQALLISAAAGLLLGLIIRGRR